MALGLGGCGGPTDPFTAPTDEVNLGIPDRAWDPDRPDLSVGWCGETCVQMAMAYYGKEVSQKTINAAAKATADVTEDNMDTAFANLGVDYIPWDESNSNVWELMAWIVDMVRKGYPVICGVKIYPDQHPDWYVDHFVLTVGFNSSGLLMNTQLNARGQRYFSYNQLASWNYGYSFLNYQNRFFIRAITGLH